MANAIEQCHVEIKQGRCVQATFKMEIDLSHVEGKISAGLLTIIYEMLFTCY